MQVGRRDGLTGTDAEIADARQFVTIGVAKSAIAASTRVRMAALTSAGSDASTRATGPASDGTTDHHSSTEDACIGVGISRTDTSVKPAAFQQLAESAGCFERERSGDARRRDGQTRLGRDRVEQQAQPRIAVTRSPDGEDGAAGRPQDPAGLSAPRTPDPARASGPHGTAPRRKPPPGSRSARGPLRGS